MLVDLLSSSNFISFNIKLAHIFGLHSAIYLNELININEKAIRKNKLEEDYFTVDRNYIYERTTLDEKEQIKIDKQLSELGLVEIKYRSKNKLKLDLSALTSVVMNNSEELNKDISKIVKSSSKKSNKNYNKDNLKSYITTTNNELYIAYTEWIDVIYDKFGFISKAALDDCQTKIDSASNHNLDKALGILKIATINGWRDVKWAIERYEKEHPVSVELDNRQLGEFVF